MVDSAALEIFIACVTHNFNVQGMRYPSGEIRGQIAMAAMLLALAACGGGSGEESGPPAGLQPTLASIQDNIFTPSCAYSSGCHQGAMAQQGLRLDDGFSLMNLFNVASVNYPFVRVSPGNPDASLLILKLEGNAQTGNQMPDGGPPLPFATVNVIRQWVESCTANACP